MTSEKPHLTFIILMVKFGKKLKQIFDEASLIAFNTGQVVTVSALYSCSSVYGKQGMFYSVQSLKVFL